MDRDLLAFFEEAAARASVPMSALTDTAMGEYPIPTGQQPRGTARIRDPYQTLQGSLGSAVGYATGEVPEGLQQVVEDCEDSASMRKFMQAVLDILIANPTRVTTGASRRLDVAKLTLIRRSI